MQHDDIMLYFSDILVYVSVVLCFLLFVYKSYYCSIPQSLDYLLHLDIFFVLEPSAYRPYLPDPTF